MRENGLPQVLTWRWTPCVALVLGSVSFVAFALVAIPDRIGRIEADSTSDSLRLGAALARGQTLQNDWSGDTTNTAAATPSPGARSIQPSVTPQNADGSFPKRGFSPPLERPEPPALPTPSPPPLQLNIAPPPTVPPPAAEPPAPAPPPPSEIVPQASPAPAQSEAPAAAQPPTPASSAN